MCAIPLLPLVISLKCQPAALTVLHTKLITIAGRVLGRARVNGDAIKHQSNPPRSTFAA